MNAIDLFICFTIYSFSGWVIETLYCTFLFKKFVNRGFLNGPFCPVYGFGALLILTVLKDVPRNPLLIFLSGMLLTSLLEYVTAYLLETLFHAKWWDYSSSKFNIKGRVCLLNSTLFGILSVILVFIADPFMQNIIRIIPYAAKNIISGLLAVYFCVDIIITVSSMHNLNLRLEALSNALAAVKEKLDMSGFYNALNIKERMEKIHELLDTDKGRAIYNSIENIRSRIKILESDNKTFQKRIIKAFPDIRSTKYPEILNRIKTKILKPKNTSGDNPDSDSGGNEID